MLNGIEFCLEYGKVRTWLQKMLKTFKSIVNNSDKQDLIRKTTPTNSTTNTYLLHQQNRLYPELVLCQKE